MTTANSSGVSTSDVSTGPTAKELKKRFGVHKAPLLVSSKAVAYRKTMAFDEQFQSGPHKQTTYSWVVIDPELVDGKRPGVKGLIVRANTYNGNLGDKVDILNPASSGSIPGFQYDDAGDPVLDAEGKHAPTPARKKALKGYEPIEIGLVPFVRVAPAPVVEKDEEGNPVEVDA